MNTIKWVMIAGTRTYCRIEEFERELTRQIENMENVGFIVTDQGAVDLMAIKYAKKHNLPINIMSVDYEKHGLAAVSVLLEEMIKQSTALLSFWNGEDHLTNEAITLARKHKLPYIWTFLYLYGARVREH
jgi:hypothetical protein